MGDDAYQTLTRDELDVLANLTVELTRLRQNECKHLCIENVGPEIFGKLLREYAFQIPEAQYIAMGKTDAT